MPIRLSKSRYVSGLQCAKRLYLEIHARELATPFDAGTQAVLDAGTRVGELARDRYPGGVLVDVAHFQIAEGLARTAALLADPSITVLCEGFTVFDDVVVRPDILVRTRGNRWRLIEVKSTSRVKDEHLHCFAPYECPFWDHCTKDKPDRWIFHLPGSRQAFRDLTALGIQTIDDIPSGYSLQLIQQRVKDNVEWIGPGLRAALDTAEKATIRTALLIYCERDTLAMVELRKALRAKARS